MLAGILPWIVTAPSPIDGAPPLAVHASGHTSTLIAVVAAFAAALGFALASVWQQQAAASVPAKMALSPGCEVAPGVVEFEVAVPRLTPALR
jgi:hypothetical protein